VARSTTNDTIPRVLHDIGHGIQVAADSSKSWYFDHASKTANWWYERFYWSTASLQVFADALRKVTPGLIRVKRAADATAVNPQEFWDNFFEDATAMPTISGPGRYEMSPSNYEVT
jgi:hypothetical protein